MACSTQHAKFAAHFDLLDHKIAKSFFNEVKDEEKAVILVTKLPQPYTAAAVFALLDGAGFANWYTLHTLPSAFVAKYNVAASLKFSCSSEATMCRHFLKEHNWDTKAPATRPTGAPAHQFHDAQIGSSNANTKAPTIVQTGATALQFHAANIHGLKAARPVATKPRSRKTASADAPLPKPESTNEISEADTTAPSPTSSKEICEIDSPSSPHESAEEASAHELPCGASSRVRAQSADSALLGERSRHESTVLTCAGAGCRVVLRRASLEVEYDDADAFPLHAPPRWTALLALQPRVRTAGEVRSDRGW